jgi:hypothetical protein
MAVAEPKSKKQLAVEFIDSIRTADPLELNRLITTEVGEELAEFFLRYVKTLVAGDPARVVQNVGTLMLMGYLVRMNEERGSKTNNLRGGPAPKA